MNIILLKLYSLFHEIKEMFHVHLFQYMITTYQSRPIVRRQIFDSEYLYILNYLIFIFYFIFRLLILGVIYLFKLLIALLVVKDKGITGVALSLIKITIFLIPLSLIVLYVYLSGDADPAKLKFYQDLHSYRTATAISDGHGHLIGAIPSPLPSPSKNISHQQRTGTLYVNGVPTVFWDVLKAQEDQPLSFNYSDTSLTDILFLRKNSYKGIRLTNLIRKPFTFIFSGKNSSGRTNLMNQIVDNLYGESYFDQQCSITFFKKTNATFLQAINNIFAGVCKKIEHVQAARHLFPYLARFNGLEFKRWSAMHTPLLLSDNDIYGLRAVSATIFGEKVERLNEAQQALLATSYRYNIRLISGNEVLNDASLQEQQIIEWQYLTERTIDAVNMAYGESQATKAADIIQRLKAITSPVPPKIPRVFVKYVKNLGTSQRQDYDNLRKRRLLFMHGFDDQVVSRLKRIYNSNDHSNNNIVTDMIITLPIIENNSFSKNIDSAMQKIVNNCRTCFKPSPDTESSDANSPVLSTLSKNSKNSALIRIIVSNEQGKIIRHYKKGDISRRSITSIAKIPASILLASLGDTANTKYCNLRYKGLRNETGPLNAGVKNCSSLNKKGRAFTFKNTFSVSQDLPFFYALTKQHKIPREALITLYRDFKINNPINVQSKTPSSQQLAYDLSFGKAQSTPLNVHQFAHKITQTLFNSEFETDPYTIDQYQVADFSKSLENYYSGALTSKNTIQKYLKLSSTKSALRKILRAPVYQKEGTLRSLQNISGVKFLFAKSGTSKTKTDAVKEKWLVGAFKINAKIYTFLIFIGTESNHERGLGSQVSNRTLIDPMMHEIIKSLKRSR